MSPSGILDNPIWHALSTLQKSFARGGALAKCFPSDVAPLSAVSEESAAAYESLRQIPGPQDGAALFLDAPPNIPPSLTLMRTFEIHQMVCATPAKVEVDAGMNRIQPLGEADVPQMLELTALTEPGPFRQRTIQLGTYIGIFSPDHNLIAMAGERLHLPDYTEVSAVCTHPDHRGKGYSRSLIGNLMSKIYERGETPFLHVKADNVSAIGLYESLGFTHRRALHLAVVRKSGSEA